MGPKRVAIVHYWIVGMRGGERVLERLIRLFPQAEIFTHVYVPEAASPLIRSRPVTTTFIKRLPGAARHYQKYLPLMPLALEQLDLRGFDLVISSESGPAKGVIVAPDAFHLCYCHSPMRYLWDHYHDYRGAAGLAARLAMPLLFHRLRQWDMSSAGRVDQILANSAFVQKRITRSWGRPSNIVHPPIDVDQFRRSDEVGTRYLWLGQMTRYKRPDIVVEAFNRTGLPLLMVGDGEMADAIERSAQPNISVVRKLNFDKLRQAYASARALIFSAQEDFGMVPVEAMASGRPVLAYRSGGVLDTIVPGKTGLFFADQTADGVNEGLLEMERWLPDFDPSAAIEQARNFSPERFDAGIRAALPWT
jgi:glycosyltransferase involved in cell wall biosynthesis